MHEERQEHGVYQRPHSRTEVDKVLGAIVVHTSLLQDAGHKVSSIAGGQSVTCFVECLEAARTIQARFRSTELRYPKKYK